MLSDAAARRPRTPGYLRASYPVDTAHTAPRIESLSEGRNTDHKTLSRDTRSRPPGRVARAAGGARVGLRQVQKTAPPGAVCNSRGARAVFCMSAAAAPPARRRGQRAANRKERETT